MMPECLTCNKKFEFKSKGKNKYCSKECVYLRRKEPIIKKCRTCKKKFKSLTKWQQACSRACGGVEFITPEKFWNKTEKDSMGCIVYKNDCHTTSSAGKPYNVNHYAFELLFKRKPVGSVFRTCKNSYCLIHLEDKQLRESRPKPPKRIKLFKVFMNCEYCREQYLVDGAHYRYKVKINQKFFCSRSCAKKVKVPGWRRMYSK